MITTLSRTSIVLCFTSIILSLLSISSNCLDFQPHLPLHSSKRNNLAITLLQQPVSRIGFDSNSLSNDPTIVLQEDGIADFLKTLSFNLPSDINEEDVQFSQTTSDPLILNVSSDVDSNLFTSTAQISSSSLNITTSLVFDGMCGIVRYTLIAINKKTEQQIDFISILFRIVGMTFYRELPDGQIQIVSGQTNKLSIAYEEAMSQTIIWQRYIKVFIQYADGSTSSSIKNNPNPDDNKLPNGENLNMQVINVKGEIIHDTSKCDIMSVGSKTISGNPQLSVGCGCGFYFGYSNFLSFGFLFKQYRVGSFSLRFTWPGVTSGIPSLSTETYELTFNIDIAGKPPLVVVGIEPFNNMLRQEGGQIRTIKMINVDMTEAISFEIRVLGLARPFKMIPDSYKEGTYPDYANEISILTEPGTGSGLTWSLYYQTLNGSLKNDVMIEAVFIQTFIHYFSFDSSALRIENVDPAFGFQDGRMNGDGGGIGDNENNGAQNITGNGFINGDGGETNGAQNITVTGFFPFFDPEVDSVKFSGHSLPTKYILSVTRWEIVFRLPPRLEFGLSYDYRITVHIGFAQSNFYLFSYYLTDASVSFRYIGLSRITADTYRFGDCSYITITASITPYTNQVLGFQWSLYAVGNSLGNNMLENTSLFNTVNSTSQSISMESDVLPAGTYILRVQVRLMKTVIESEIIISRENVLSIGTTILPIGNLTLSEVGSVLRMVAIVTEPSCLYTDGQLTFEWEGFNTKQIYSWENTTYVPTVLSGIEVTRLGWELVIPEKYVKVGSHDISFLAHVPGNNTIYGSASTSFFVDHGPLIAVIRNGEKQLDVNSKTTITLFGKNSYDTDVSDDTKFDGITYDWQCLLSVSSDFSTAETSPCPAELLPDSTAQQFSASMSFLQLQSNVRYIQYSLMVRKGSGRISPIETLLIQVQDGGGKPYLDDYTVSLTDAEGEFVCASMTEYYQDIIINVAAPVNGTTWTYELIKPVDLAFFSSVNIYDHPSYYSLPSTIMSSVIKTGSDKPLGIRADALNPATTYSFKITFYSEFYQVTEVVYNIRTIDSVVVHMSEPSLTQVQTNTPLSITAGVSSYSNQYSYFFTLMDSLGNEYCAGGCTGNDVTFFSLSRPENYTMSTYVCDTEGRVISTTTAKQIVQVLEPTYPNNPNQELPSGTNEPSGNVNNINKYESELNMVYEYGNDQQWLQSAQDAAISLLEESTINANPVEQLEQALNLANDSTAVFCNSYSNAFYSQDCVKLMYKISQIRNLDADTFYFIMETVTCCVEKTAPRTILSVIQWLPNLISELIRSGRGINQVGTTRRRLLQTPGIPANAVADVYIWTSRIMAYGATSGMSEGFTQDYNIGTDRVAGYITVSIASQESDLENDLVNGVPRSIVKGPSSNELFYARDQCFDKLFTNSKRRVLTLLTVDNFVLLGFQDEPIRGNLVDRIYWTQAYEKDSNGFYEDISLEQDAYCYCWRLPVVRMKEQLQSTVDIMPGLYAVTDLKSFQRDAQAKGDVYTYDYANSKTSDYNISEGWIEGCRVNLGLLSTTIVSKSATNILDGGLSVVGFAAWAIVGLVVGGIMLIMVAVVSSWLIAVRAVSDGLATGEVEGEAGVYVERDVYGRGTMFGNIFRAKSRE